MSDSKKDEQTSATLELIDCGQVSEKTKGVPIFFLFELGYPPCDKLFLL